MTATAEQISLLLREQQGQRTDVIVRNFRDEWEEVDKGIRSNTRDILRDMGELRVEIIAALVAAGGAALAQAIPADELPTLLAEVDGRLDDFILRARNRLETLVESNIEAGTTITARSIRAADVPVSVPVISGEIQTAIRTRALDAFDTAIDGVRTNITGGITNSVTAGETLAATNRRLSGSLDTRRRTIRGVRRLAGNAFKLELINQTEARSAFSQAQQEAAEQLAITQLPQLRKRWVTTLRERRGHRAAERRYAVGGTTGPIPINSRFEVQDFSRTGTSEFATFNGRRVRVEPYTRTGRVMTARMLHPRDPTAPPGFVIGCTCFTLDVPGELAAQAEQTLGIISG